MHRFYLSLPLPPTGACVVAGEPAHRIARVLRLRPGDTVRLFDGSGREVETIIGQVRPGAVTVSIIAELPPEAPEPQLHLYQALIRPNRYEWLLEKATELGATTITPVITERCQVRATELGRARAARWSRIVAEAAEQCGRRTLPRLGEPQLLAAALTEASGLLLLPWEAERIRAAPLGEALGRQHPRPDTVSILIGPEGGFTRLEAEAALARGALPVSLGRRVLRAETAALAALAITQDTLSSGA